MMVTTFALNRFNNDTRYWFLFGFIFMKEFFNLLMNEYVFRSIRESREDLHERDIFHLPVYFLVHFLSMDIYSVETVQLANQNLEYPIYESVWNVYMTMHLKQIKQKSTSKSHCLTFIYQMFVHEKLLRMT